MSIEGSVIVERQDANTLAYNQNVTVKMLLSGVVPYPDWAEPLVKTLESCTYRPGVRDWIDDRAEEQVPYAFDSTDGTHTTGPKAQRFSSFLGKKKKDIDFPPRHWGKQMDSGSYFSGNPDDQSPAPWEDIDGPHRRLDFEDDFEPGLSSAQRTNHRSSRRVSSISPTPVDSYNPASPFNSLPPFRSVHSTLSDKTTSHLRSMSVPKPGYSTENTNPFSITPPPEEELERVEPPPSRFKTKPELSKPLSPLEGVARAIALYEFKAIEVCDQIWCLEYSHLFTTGGRPVILKGGRDNHYSKE